MEVIHALQSVASPALDRLMLIVTQLGSQQAYVVLLLVTYIGVDARIGRRLAVYFLAGFYLNEQLKALFHTERPFRIDPGVLRSQGALATAGGNGFPSGHAQGSTTFWGLAAAYGRRAWLTAAAVLLVAAISLSRLYLGVHLPVDVIGGILIGLAVLFAGLAIDRMRLEVPKAWVLLAGLAVPLAVHLLLPTPDSGVLLGALAAFLVGPELVPHATVGPWPSRALLSLLGLALVFAVQLGSGALLAPDVRHLPLVSFVRYLLVGLTGTMLVPALGRAARLTPSLRS
ncbi:MAG TPA: phosphatase PAP2 family protein [Trueperaceae bacterium]|nr:phosphatase PAP2 family protein [Trueperaceae bacterium]